MECNHFFNADRVTVLSGGAKREAQLIEQYSITTATMSNTTFNRKNRTKKGISPVIATVILVAVAVVIAAALAGFASSLFGTYSSAGSAVTITSATISADTDEATVSLINSGNTSDAVQSIQVNNGVSFPVADGELLANAVDPTEVTTEGQAMGEFEDGDVVTVKVTLRSGLVLSHSVVVSP